jgi:hypothetical protein
MLPLSMPTVNSSVLGPYISPASLHKLKYICQKFPQIYGKSESLSSSELPAILREEIHTVPESSIPIKLISVSFSLQIRCFQICLFFSSFPAGSFYKFFFSPIRTICPAHLIQIKVQTIIQNISESDLRNAEFHVIYPLYNNGQSFYDFGMQSFVKGKTIGG